MRLFNSLCQLAAAVAFASLGASAHAQECLAGSYARTAGSPGAALVFSTSVGPGVVYATTRWDPDGVGPQAEGLVIVGRFDEMDGVSAHNIAFFDGTRWRPVGDDSLRPVPLSVHSIRSVCVHNGELVVAGFMNSLEGQSEPYNHLARWDGSVWRRVTGADGSAGITLVGTPGAGMTPELMVRSHAGKLVVSGSFTVPGTTISNLAAWDGAGWSGLGLPVEAGSMIRRIEVLGNDLYVGTWLPPAGLPLWKLGADAQWSAVSAGLQPSTSNQVDAMAVSAGDVYIGGNLQLTGSGPSNRVVRWNGSLLASVSTGAPNRIASVAHAAGETYVTLMPGVGTIYRDIGGFLTPVWPSYNRVNASPELRLMGVFNGRMLVGGVFQHWSWGLNDPEPRQVWSLAWHDPAGPITLSSGFDARVCQFARRGDEVYAVGRFTSSCGERTNRVARRDGDRWTAVGGGLNEDAWCVTEFNGDLIVGGSFSAAGGVNAPFVARWDGAAWHAMGALPRHCRELAVAGGVLYARVAAMQNGRPSGNTELFRWSSGAWESVTTQPFLRLIPLGEDLYGVGASGTTMFGPLRRVRAGSVQTVTTNFVQLKGVHNGRLIVTGGLPFFGTYAFDPTTDIFSMIGSADNVPMPVGFNEYADIRNDVEYRGEMFVGTGGVAEGGGSDRPGRWNGASWALLEPFQQPTVGPNSVRCSVPFVDGEELWFGHAGIAVRSPSDVSFRQSQASWSSWQGPARPAVIAHPVGGAFNAGQTISLTFDIAPAEQTYQWVRAGVPLVDGPTEWGSIISGAATATLTIFNAQPAADSAAYMCTVADPCGPVVSMPATLYVQYVCDSIDFNGDGLFPDNQDVIDFFSVFGGGSCSTGTCGDIDFNNDGLFPDNRDIQVFLNVFGGVWHCSG